MTETLGTLYLVLIVVGIVVAILWILVPFMIMGTNRRLDKMNREVAASHQSLADIHFLLREIKNAKEK